jgi:hypothetical protein
VLDDTRSKANDSRLTYRYEQQPDVARLWAAGAGPADLADRLTVDLDAPIVPVYGRGKQGAAFGDTKVRGYQPQFATCAETGMVLFSPLRGGSGSAPLGGGL